MSSSLLTYCLVGPKNVDLDNRSKAVELVKQMYGFIDEAREIEKKAEMDFVGFDAYDAQDSLAVRLPTPLAEFLANGNDWPHLENLRYGDGKPETLVDDFLKLWTASGSDLPNDANWRDFVLPDGTNWHVLFAGDISYGDEPEGDGYVLLKIISNLEVHNIFGIH